MKKRSFGFRIAVLILLGWVNLCFSQSLDEILEKHMAALGGKENLLQVKTMYAEARTKAGGLEGKLRVWSREPGRMRQEDDFSIFRQVIACDGKSFWLKDQNGKVRELIGYERQKLMQELYFEAYAYLLPQRGEGEKELIGKKEIEGQGYFVLEVTPDGGEPRRLFINSSNYLVDRYQEPADEETVTVFLTDYRPVDGIMTPFRSRQTAGKPQYDTYIEYEEILVNPSLNDTLFLRPRERGKDFRFGTSAGCTEIPFELVSNHIYLKVRINGSSSLSFILDTGASANCLDLLKAEELGIQTVGRVEAKGVGGSSDASFLKADSISVGDLTLWNQNIAGIRLSPLGRFDGRDIDGLLGYDFFSRFVVQIDYVDRILTVWEPDSFAYSGPGEKIDILIEGNTPQLRGTLDGELVADFRIDTGSRNSLDLHAPFVRRHKLLEKYPKYVDAPAGFGVGGATKGMVGRLKSLQIGTFIIPSPVTGFSLAEQGAFATTKSAGNVGGGLFKRFKVIFDYAHNQMILEKNKNFGLPERYYTSGLVLVEEGGSVKVYNVIENSPADQTGIKAGDRILKINGSPVSNHTLEQIRGLLNQKEGTKIRLEVESRGPARELGLILRELI